MQSENSGPAAVLPQPQGSADGRDPHHIYSLALKPYELAEMKRHHLQLVYAATSEGPGVHVLAPDAGNDLKISAHTRWWIARALSQAASAYRRGDPVPILWLAERNEQGNRLFMYLPLNAEDLESGWLGLILNNVDARIDLKNLAGGRYVLSDQNQHAMLSSNAMSEHRPHDIGLPALRRTASVEKLEDSFEVVGDGWIPQYLLLRKSVGEAGWFLSYHVPIEQLIKDNMRKLQFTALLCLAFILVLLLFVHFMRRLALIPALVQQKALKDSEALNRKLIDTAPAGLAVIRRGDRKILLSNALAQHWVRCDPRWFEHACEEASVQGSLEQVLSGGSIVQISSRATNYGGEPVLLCMVSDVTALKQVQESLMEAKLRAESANQAKTLFLATMSHEIRTPLYGILGTLELLSLSKAPGEQSRYLETMQQASATLLRVVNDSLDLSAIEAGHLKLEMHPFSPAELLDNVVAGFISRAEKKGLQLYCVADVNTPPLLLGDALRLRQILDNLVSNSIKFTLSGHIAISLKATGQSHDPCELRFEVRDTGVGISLEQQPYLFNPYFRAQTAAALKEHGTGLGLSICSRLVQQMGGRLTAVSEPGLGTCISFDLAFPVSGLEGAVPAPRLASDIVYVDGAIAEVVNNLCSWLRHWGAMAQPYREHACMPEEQAILVEAWPRSLQPRHWDGKRVLALAPGAMRQKAPQRNVWEAATYGVLGTALALQQAQGGAASRAASALVATAMQGHEHMGLHVLIVEDNPINQLILREQLQLLGCHVEQASNGQEALSVPGLLDFDLVLTDLHMPVLDGFGLVRALRMRGFHKPVIGLTANAYPQEQGVEKDAGFTCLICKPFSLPLLRSTLKKIQ